MITKKRNIRAFNNTTPDKFIDDNEDVTDSFKEMKIK